ncbi:hypothetical protein [Actinomadura sp. WMMB 499]|uniref:hypothetical protein n=1 Tax=Actinomadura sp. WMMB 499 TaxID=1219491 RepID=UPI001248AA6A|nr:hypothetical protein [Actinomadura sp. WMMB 499]QFG21309.1 hypothetical protein F7P10_09350 [Actinomadura sp. WMMB 499]
MEAVRLILLLLHTLGFAVFVGGLIAQRSQPEKKINGPVRDGAGVAVVSGIALVGVIQADGGDINIAKIAVKLGIGVLILALTFANMRREHIGTWLWTTLLVLGILDIGVAIFWSPVHGS